MFSRFFFLLILVLIIGCQKTKTIEIAKSNPSSLPLFTLLTEDHTNIDFQNNLKEGLNINVLMYEYLYNGGGVATADFNGDDLIDIYFTSNLGENKFYINKGNMQFMDATDISNIAGRMGPWKTGVTAVDINGDNKLDIYLCYSGSLPADKRVNQLFINQGNDENGIPIFEDKAKDYGLDTPAFSNQAYFFDYDHDGDLDVLMLNHNPKSIPILNEVKTKELLKVDDPLRGLRLYNQNNGVFKDVTEISGISGSALSYGLGIGISDLNNDGWVDFYISNDYNIPDYLYENNGDGTFTNIIDKSMGHTSHFSMGNNIADINNDGWQDIFTLDMLPEDNKRQKLLLSPDNYEKFNLNLRSGFHHQYMRNMLQLNNGNGTYSEIGQLSGISNTDWSWAALIADYDNDGWKDLYITNGYFRDYTNLDFIDYMESYIETKGKLVREDVLKIIEKMPSTNVSNYMYSNQNGTHFIDVTKSFGLNQTSNSNGAAYADLDNDGDLDLIVNNINKPAFIYRNESQKSDNHFLQVKLKGEGLNTQGIGSKITLFSKGQQQNLEQVTTRGYLSSVSPILQFGLGNTNNIDSLQIIWNNGQKQTLRNIKSDILLVLEQKDAKLAINNKVQNSTLFKKIKSPVNYTNKDVDINDFKRQSLLISELSHSGPCMTKSDINNDGLVDIYIGGAKGQSGEIFLQQKDKTFKNIKIPAFENDKIYEDADAIFFDANVDGNIDLYVASGGYHDIELKDNLLQDRLYLGDGNGNFSKSKTELPLMNVSKGSVSIHDINKDGYIDIFVGGRVIPGRYPETPESFLLINDGKGNFSNQIQNIAPKLQNFGMITDSKWIDFNADGKKELIVVGEWTPVSIFAFKDEVLVDVTSNYFDQEYKGWWNKIETGDFNGDGKPDLILGNMGTNTQFKVSESEPAEMYYKDFDNNGSVDPLFCFYIQGKSYPYVTRGELLGQLGFLRSKFIDYKSYADASITDIFNEEDLSNAKKLAVNHMETTLFMSTEDGKYNIKTLPFQAQYSPVHAITVSDFNKDGKEDILLMGNNHHFKLRLGKFDANYGVLLIATDDGGFKYLNQSESGLNIHGAVKSSLKIDQTLFLGINKEAVEAYRFEE